GEVGGPRGHEAPAQQAGLARSLRLVAYGQHVLGGRDVVAGRDLGGIREAELLGPVLRGRGLEAGAHRQSSRPTSPAPDLRPSTVARARTWAGVTSGKWRMPARDPRVAH